jgi:hypothetical protein
MIKDIVVELSVGERASPAEDYAVSVAAAFDAHVVGIAFLYYPVVPVTDGGYTFGDIVGSRSGAGNVPPEMIETQQRDNAAATKAAIDRFANATARAGVSAEPLSPGADFGSAGEHFGRIARHSISPLLGRPDLSPARLRKRPSRPPCSILGDRSSSFPTSRKRRSSLTA